MMIGSRILFVFCITFSSVYTQVPSIKIFGNDPEVTSEVRDPKKDAETVCEAFNAKPDDMKLNLTGRMEYEDMLRLMTWSLKYNLKSNETQIKFNSKLDWKREIVELLSRIFKIGCPGKYVSGNFVNVAKELFLIYLNSVTNDSESTKDMWPKTLETLKSCEDKIGSLMLGSRGYEAAYLSLKDDKGNEEKVEVLPPEEVVDGSHTVDIIIDAVWWMFSFSFASCYPLMENKSVALAQYKKLFYNDFVVDLINRWKYGGRWTMAYGPIFGDMHIVRAIKNTRFCVTAAYTKSAIADRQLVRPLGAFNDEGSAMSNRKTGELF